MCTRNRPDELGLCLESLAHLRYPEFEILVVDNAPLDARSREVAARWHVRYLLEPAQGLSRARNAGVRACRTSIVAFIDDDARAEPDWLAALAREFDDPAVMAVAGRTLPLAVVTETEQLFRDMGGYDSGNDRRREIDSSTPRWFEMANFGGIGTGTNMAFRRSAFDVWPGFDPRLGLGSAVPGNEEHHAFFSLLDRGFRMVYTPAATVRHPFPAEWEQLGRQQRRTLGCGAAYLMFLLREEPRYRKRLLRFVLASARRKAAHWRCLPAAYRAVVPLWQQVPVMLWSALRGMAAYRGGDHAGRA